VPMQNHGLRLGVPRKAATSRSASRRQMETSWFWDDLLVTVCNSLKDKRIKWRICQAIQRLRFAQAGSVMAMALA
jgi:putative component of toxin-antitoxin plasmid stabilization module